MCFSTARSDRNSCFAIAALLRPGGHLGEHVSLAVGQVVQRRAGLFGASEQHALDDLRVERRAAAAHVLQRADQLVDLRHPLLQQVSETSDAVGEQVEREIVLGVLGQHDDARRPGTRRGCAWRRRCPPR